MVETAATHGVYSSTNVRKLSAAAGVNVLLSAANTLALEASAAKP